MAIIIPSKNIYEIDNQKIKKNIIDNVSVEQTIISPSNEYNVSIHTQQIGNKNFQNGELKKHYDYDVKTTSGVTGITIWGKSYVELKSTYLKKYRIVFDGLKDNKLVNKIYQGLNDKGEENIKYSVFYNKKKYNISVSNIVQISGNNVELKGYLETLTEDVDGSGKMPKPEISIGSSYHTNPYTSTHAEIVESDLTNIASVDIKQNTTTKQFYLDVTVLVGLETLALTGLSTPVGSSVVPCSGEKVVYYPKSIELTFYGDTIGIDLTDGSVKVGNGNKPYSLSGNELLQDSGKVGETPLAKYLATNVLSQYENGKETATLLCDINEYYRQKDDYVFNPRSYDEIRNATYNNGIVKQINEDYEDMPDTNVDFDFVVGEYDTFRLTSPNEVKDLELMGSYSTRENEGSYQTDIILTLTDANGKPTTLERDLNISFREDLETSMSATVTIPSGESSVTFSSNTQNPNFVINSIDQIYSMLTSITLSGGTTYPSQINKFEFSYGDALKKEWNITTTPQKLEFEFNKIRGGGYNITFGAYGNNEDTYISYQDYGLEYGVPYKFSVNVTNIINGKVSWQDIKIERTVNDTLAISTKDKSKPMTFEIGDEVIPMVYTANGIDEPISKKKDNSPKVFRIVGREIIYDGAVWQKIYLQEK